MKFIRNLHGILYLEWIELLEIISHISYTHSEYKLSWRWEAGKFTVKFLYKLLNFRGIKPNNAMLWWSIPVPLKVRVIIWLTAKNKILTKNNLRKKRMEW